jgi:hypothetical protein
MLVEKPKLSRHYRGRGLLDESGHRGRLQYVDGLAIRPLFVRGARSRMVFGQKLD